MIHHRGTEDTEEKRTQEDPVMGRTTWSSMGIIEHPKHPPGGGGDPLGGLGVSVVNRV